MRSERLHGGVDFGKAEAAFLGFDVAALLENRGVDQDVLLVLGSRVAGDVDDEKTVRQIDLVGGQPDAIVLVHQFEHLGDGFAQLGIDPLQLPRLVTQGGMGIFDDPQDFDSRQ